MSDMKSENMALAGDAAGLAGKFMELIGGFQISQAIYVLAKLDVATALANGPRRISEVADEIGAKGDILRRLIRTLAPTGLFHRLDNDVAELTPLGMLLSRTHPTSLRAITMFWMETHYLPFSALLHTVQTGQNAAQRYLGKPFFEWISQYPDLVELQNSAFSTTVRGTMFDEYQLPPGRVVADIGGADGTVLTRLLAREADRTGIVLDLPEVVAGAHQVIAAAGMTDRIRVMPGSFFEEVPKADVYILSAVLHDWDDEPSLRILNAITRAASPGARLVLSEMVIPPGDEPHHAKLADLTMLAMLSGRERSAAEWSALLAKANFTLDRVVPTPSPFCLLEATLR
jgi:O-methyltransferase domain/Dimerisation domain